MERWWKRLDRWKWPVVAVWIAAAVVSATLAPDINRIVREQDNTMLPLDSETAQARELLKRVNPDRRAESGAVLVLAREGGLLDSDREWLKAKAEEWKRDKRELGIEGVQSAFDRPELAQQFESADRSAMLITVDIAKLDYDPATQDTVKRLRERLTGIPEGAEAYLTGSAPIAIDFQASSEAGLHRTEVLTVALVLIILLIVFRSPIAPLVPLVTIALSFLVSRGLVGLAAAEWGMPVSNFTQSFLIAVLFGAGTDYCILLIHRFREELSGGHDRLEAPIRTVRAVGKTVGYSASTVFITFFF